MTSPAGNNLDTTTGGGDDVDGGANDPVYRAPAVTGPPVAGTNDTTDSSGGTRNQGIGRTGDTDPHTADPQTLGDTTQGGGFTIGGDVGDTDSHSHDPNLAPPDTTIGGGGINTTANPAYRTNLALPTAEEKDTTTQFGQENVSAGSPDTAAVGTGVNPNAAEPGLTNSAYDVGGTKDTTYAGAAFGGNAPVNDGTPPAAPTGVTVALAPNVNEVTVSWTPPANAAATKVTRYVIETNTLGTQQAPANATSVDYDQGLIPGQTYTFTVYAESAQGSGRRSVASAPITMPSIRNLQDDLDVADGLQGPSDQVPGASVAPVATIASPTSVSVAFVAPANNGGSPITEYTVVSTPGGITKVGTGSPLVVTGLTTSTAYTFKVKARNVYGYGPLSPASNSVTPA